MSEEQDDWTDEDWVNEEEEPAPPAVDTRTEARRHLDALKEDPNVGADDPEFEAALRAVYGPRSPQPAASVPPPPNEMELRLAAIKQEADVLDRLLAPDPNRPSRIDAPRSSEEIEAEAQLINRRTRLQREGAELSERVQFFGQDDETLAVQAEELAVQLEEGPRASSGAPEELGAPGQS